MNKEDKSYNYDTFNVMVEPIVEGVYWKCPFCEFKAISREVTESHIRREHERPPPRKKVNNSEFTDFIGLPVVVILRNGMKIEGRFVEETQASLILENVTIAGSNRVRGRVIVSKEIFGLMYVKQ